MMGANYAIVQHETGQQVESAYRQVVNGCKLNTGGPSHWRSSSTRRGTHRTVATDTAGPVLTVGVLARMEAKRAVVNVAQAPNEVEQEERAQEEVEDAVPDHLAVYGDDVSTLGAAPCDRVNQGDERDEACTAHEAAADACTGAEGRARAVTQEGCPEK